MAHVMGAGTTSYGRDSRAKRLGVKKFGGEKVSVGDIIVRQRGSKYEILNDGSVALGKDYTIFALKDGEVKFGKVTKQNFSGRRVSKTSVCVV